MEDGKRISAYTAFKAKQNATPKTEHHGKVEKPETSTPFVGLIKQGRGKLKKIRESARSKKTKKAVKRSEGMARRLQTEDMDIDEDRPGSSKSSSRSQPTKIEDPKPREISRKKRKSPCTTTPEMGRRKNITPPLQPTEPTAKRLKFNDNGKDSTIAGPSSIVPDNSLKRDSLQHGKDVFAWLISPFKVEDYFKNIFERKPLFLKRHNMNYFTDIFSSEELSDILKENDLQFTRNIDVTTYTNGKRETHNPTGRAQPQVVWDYYRNGCSVRILNPQTYSTRVCQLLAALQEFFGCFVGANIYLTPPGSQGFAPHYDDIEAFVLQLEGKKHWKLYNQRSPSEVLPRFSSSNFTDADIGEPILNTTLEAGDLLYFPRGVIHQASTPSETHSLHITISACQKNTWGDLMEHVLTRALHVVREENIEFRKSLPIDYLNYMGVAHQDLDDDRRQPFMKKIGDLFSKLLKSAPVDAAVDQMSFEFFHTSLPPVLEEAEESCCVFGENASCKNGLVSGLVELSEDTQIRLLRRNILRLVPEEGKVLVYHSVENSRVYKEKELQFIEIPPEFAPAVEHLIHSYPDYIPVSTLGDQLEDTNEENADPVDLAQTLYEKGLLMTRSKLEPYMSLHSDRHKDVTICQTR